MILRLWRLVADAKDANAYATGRLKDAFKR